jgi:PAS domain S-box-containing protein
VQGTAREITERRESQKALKASEERLRELIENANDIIFTCDMLGNITSLNRTGQRLTGYSSEEAIGMNFEQFVAEEYVETAAEMLSRKAVADVPTVYELEIVTRSGARVAVEVSSRTIFAEGKPIGVQGVARDITERKRTEEALHASQVQLQQSQKLEAVGQLAGGVAHDFNNLLTAIIGYSQLSLRRLDPDDPIARNINEIMKAAGRAASLTRQLLAFSRKQILEAKVLDLNIVVNDMFKMLCRLIGEDIELATVPAPNLNKVKADSCQIEQIIMNLVVNARDAMPGGGKLTIETANVLLDSEYALQHLPTLPGAYVMLAVSDTGTGMDQQTLSRIFEPFFTTKELGKGTGLGLSTVYGIVKQSGGYIWVYSEVGKGTTLKVYLPRVNERLVPDTPRPAPRPIPGGSETILLVEDDDQVREIAREILERKGYRALPAANGEQALAVAQQQTGKIDLMITDVVMPQMSGRELAEHMSLLRPEMKILYMSGYTDDATVRHGLLDRQFEFIQKPFTADVLARKVRDTLDG